MNKINTLLVLVNLFIVNILTGQVTKKDNNNSIGAGLRSEITKQLKQSQNKILIQKNLGQLGENIQYAFLTSFGAMYVEKDHIRLVALKQESEDILTQNGYGDKPARMESHAVKIFFEGGSSFLDVQPLEQQPTEVNYFKGTDPKKWHTQIPTYGELMIRNVYPGVNLRLYSDQYGTMEFDWVLDKASDLSKIKMRVTGQDKITDFNNGGFSLGLRMANIDFKIPESYQVIGNNKVPVSVRYRLSENNLLVFESIGVQDPNAPLIVDPTVLWGTWFDGNNSTFDGYSFAVEIDSCGNAIVATSVNLDVTSVSSYGTAVSGGGYDATYNAAGALIYKMNATGTTISAFTYLDQNDQMVDVDIFPNGNIIVGGFVGTSNTTFPTLNAYSTSTTNTAVVAIFNSSLNTLIYATRLPGRATVASLPITGGGTTTSLGVTSIEVAGANSYYVAGITDVTLSGFAGPGTVPDATRSGSEGYIARFSGTDYNTRDWATYIGGDNAEEFIAIRFDMDQQNLCFAGYTNSSSSSGFPATTSGAVDATWGGNSENWVGVISNSSTIGTSFNMLSYLGGNGNEGPIALDCDSNYIYIIGQTTSSTMAGVTSGVYDQSQNGGYDHYVSRVPISGSSNFRTTYIGGSADEYPGGIIFNNLDKNLYIFGTSDDGTTDYPTQNTTPGSNYFDNTHGGALDVVLGSVSSDLTTLRYSSFLGGSDNDYLGNTGALKGSGQYSYNITNNMYALTTTVHSDVTGSGANQLMFPGVFDPTYTSPSVSNRDAQILMKMNLSSADLGDAPAIYEKGNPAKHAFNPRLTTEPRLGSLIDADVINQANDFATGDDDAITKADPCSGTGDDEDGAGSWPVITVESSGSPSPSYSINVQVYNSSGTSTLHGWIDFDDSGTWSASEHASTTISTTSSGLQTATLTWSLSGKTCPNAIVGGRTYARLRISSSSNPLPTDNTSTWQDERALGVVNDGEVEDYFVNIRGRDYGDLSTTSFPDYPVASAIRYGDYNDDNIPDDTGSIWAGTRVDIETACTPATNAAATADDNSNSDDEDGLVFPGVALKPSTAYNFTVNLSGVTSGRRAYYGIWFDMNGDGDFSDATDQFVNGSALVTTGSGPYTASVIRSITTPSASNFNRLTFATRLMVSSMAVNVTDSNSNIANGEVEDYVGDFAPSISGNVYNDQDGINDNAVDGPGINNPSSTQLWAYALNGSGNIVDSMAVRSNGSFDLFNIAYSTSYTVKVSTTRAAIGTSGSAIVASLPSTWYPVSEKYGLNDNTSNNNLIESGYSSANMIIPVAIGTSVITRIDFGIDREPESNNVSSSPQTNPGGTVRVTAPTLAGSDPEQGSMGVGKRIRITSLPSNANVYYNGTLLVSGSLPYTYFSYSSSALTVDPTFNGAGTVVFNYIFVDSAGVPDPTPATITMPFTDPAVILSGTVYDDGDGLTDNDVDGTGIGSPDATQLYAYLDSAGRVVRKVTLPGNGTYSFSAVINTSYTVIISSTNVTVGSVSPSSAALPANWISTGEEFGTNNGAGTGVESGAANSRIAVNVVTSAITVVDFGIDKRPTSDDKTAASQLNPGGTVRVAVPVLTGDDLEDGTLNGTSNDTVVIKTLPTNATLYYNGTAVTVGQVIRGYSGTLLTVDPNFNGAGTVVFTYVWKDAANAEDLTAATVTMPFTAINISGIVYHDPNGVTDLNVNGTAQGVFVTTRLWAYLVYNGSNTIYDSSMVANNGTFLFDVADANSSYSVIISSTRAGIGNTPPSITLPANWLHVGEEFGTNNGAGTGLTSGTPNGNIPTSTTTVNVTNIEFGIEYPTYAHDKTYVAHPDSIKLLTGLPIPGFARWTPLNYSSGTNDTTFNTGVMTDKPGKVSGFDIEDGRFGGLIGATTSYMVFVNLPDTSNALLQYNTILLVPNPTVVNPSFIYWNSTKSRYEIPLFDAANLKMLLKLNGQTSTTFRYLYIDAAGVDGRIGTYTISYSSPLPVAIKDFTCKITGTSNIALTWKLYDPYNVNYVKVMRSIDGTTFKEIGRITDINRTAPVVNMSFMDEVSENGLIAYKLISVENNGAQNVSTTCLSRVQTAFGRVELTIAPNPAPERTTLTIKSPVDQNFGIQLTDIYGKVISISNLKVNSIAVSDIDLSNVAPGVYFIKVSWENYSETLRVVRY